MIKILTIGKNKERWLIEALAEYEKRLRNITWQLVKNDRELLQQAKKERNLIGLDPKGKLLDSEEFSTYLYDHLPATFVIGGPDGLPRSLDAPLISLSPLTFTHQMARLILVEQVYRASEIRKGSPYHRY